MTASSDSITSAALGFPGRTLGLLVLFAAGAVGSWLGLFHLRSRFAFESFAVSAAHPIPVERVRLKARGSYPVHFLLLHGYGANRRHLLHLAEVLAAAGGEVFLMDLPGRGHHTGWATPRSPGGFDASMPTPRETRAALAVVRHLQGLYGVGADRLVVVGHSLGGGVALDVARGVLPAAVVSLAGLERRIEPGWPRNLFLITARVEIPAVRRAADRMYDRARAARSHQPSRAARGEYAATHSSLSFHSPVQRAIVDWANRALPGAGLATPAHFNEWLLGLEAAGLFFLAGLFVPLAGLAARALPHEPLGEIVPETGFTLWSPVHIVGYALLAGLAAVSILHLLRYLGGPLPLGFLRLDGGSYLASVLLLATVWLLPLLLRLPWVRSWRETGTKAGLGLALAAYIIVAGGGFVTWQLFDLWPTPGRAARMALLVVLLFPYALGEELFGRTYAKAPRRPSPLDAFLAWRLGLLASLFYAAVVLGSGEWLLVVMAIPLLLLSLLEYFFSAALRRALASAYANAVLKALLLGWIPAVLFPLE